MDIRESQQSDFLILELTGRLDTKTSPQLEKKLIELLNEGSRRLVIDLKELEYVSSAGLRVLLMTAKKLNGMDGHLALSSMNESVRQVFDIAGFTSVFTIAATSVEAVRTAPAETKKSKVADLAARMMGLEKASSSARAPSRDPEASGLAARAAQILGVKVSQSPVPSPSREASASPEPKQDKDADKRKKWFKR